MSGELDGSLEHSCELDQYYMRQALDLARQAAQEGEVPVGAVLVRDGEVIGRGFNRPIGLCDASAHAEINALRDAGAKQNNYRLPNATLYVTIEPCTMCVGAMVHARIGRLVYGAPEPKAGAVNSRSQLLQAEYWNHRVSVTAGVLAEEASAVMQAFFAARRQAIKALKQSI